MPRLCPGTRTSRCHRPRSTRRKRKAEWEASLCPHLLLAVSYPRLEVDGRLLLNLLLNLLLEVIRHLRHLLLKVVGVAAILVLCPAMRIFL